MAIVINPQGVVGEVPDNQIQDALAQGYASAAPEQAQAFLDDRQRRETYGTTGQAILGGVEAGARALTFGLSDVLEQGLLGAKPEGIRAREEENPIAAGIGTGVGILGPLLIPGVGEAAAAKSLGGAALAGGEVAARAAPSALAGVAEATAPALISRLGSGAARMAGEALPEASTALGKALRGAAVEGARGVAEGAAYGVGNVVHEAALGDPDLTWQKAATEIGLSGLLGGGIGGALGAPGGAISHLLEGGAAEGGSKIGAKLADWLGEFQGQRGIKAAGGIQSDITRVEKQIGRARLNELGQEMFDHGLVGPLSTPASTLERAQALQEKAGGEIGAMLREADAKTAHEAMPQIAEVVGKARAEILAPMVANPLEQDAAGRIARVLDGYENKFSGGMTPSDLHGMRKQVDKAIYGLRGNMDPFATPMKDALHDLRGIVSDEIDKAIEGAGIAPAAWKASKRAYEVASRAEEFADKGLHRAQGNNLISLTEVMGGLSGGVAAGPLAGLATGAGVAFARRQASGLLGAAAGAARDLLTGGRRLAPDVAPSVEHVAADAARVVRGERPGEVRIITPQRPRGEPGRYDVVEAADLVPSHKPQSFVPDPRYPAGVQERPYHTSQEEQGKVNAIGRDLNPALVLADTPTAVDGPPIVTSGVKRYVLGGNGRTMGIQRAFASPAVRENYKRELAARAAAFGIHPDRVAAMKAPVLVRVAEGVPATASKADLQAAVRRFNEGLTQELSPRARAVAEGKALRPVTIESIGTLLADGGDKSLRDLMRDKAQAFVTILQRDGLITNENRAAMQAGDGLTSFAKDRIEGMFLGRVLGTGERLDGTAPGVLQKLERITPQILRVEGVNPALSEIPTVQAAIDLMNRAQRAGGSVDDLLRQQGLAIAGGPAAPDAATIALARLLGSENQAQLAARFTKWAREAAVDPNQGMMFGKPPTAAEARRTLFAGTGTDAPSAPAAAIPTWGEFTKARMGEYMKKYGGHGPAMKQLSAEFKALKGGGGGERTAPAGLSDADLTHRVVPAPEASKDPDWVFAKDAPPAPETVAALGVLKAAVEKVDRRLDTLASTLVRSGVKALNVARTEVVAGVAAHHAHEPEKVRADFRRDRARYLQLAHNPSMALDSLDAATADIHPHAPAVAQAAAIDIATKVQYLASIVPHPFVAGALADPIDPPLSAIQTFRRLEGVVNDPSVLLKKAAAGTLSLDEVAAGDATARPLMEDLRQRTFDQIVIHGIPKDRHARLMLSFLFGRDLDGSIAMLDSNQATYHRAPSAPSQAMPPAAGADALNVGQRSQTDSQRAAGRT